MHFWTGDARHHLWCNGMHYTKTSFLRKLSNLTMFKTRKNFKKMDKINVQKSTCRITFVQKRAALGNLRNFFGGIFVRAYMVRENAPIKHHLLRVGAKRAVLLAGMSLFGAFLFLEKSFLRFWDCRINRHKNAHVPFWGVLVLEKTWLMIGNVFQNCMF